jgi:hypothetical protein
MQRFIERLQHDSETAAAENFQNLVMPETTKRIGFRRGFQECERHLIGGPGGANLIAMGRGDFRRCDGRAFKEPAGLVVSGEQPFDADPLFGIASTCRSEIRSPFRRCGLFECGSEDRFVGHGVPRVEFCIRNAKLARGMAHGFSRFVKKCFA